MQFTVFTLDVIAIPKEEQKVENFHRFSKIKTAKFIIPQQKRLRKSSRIFSKFTANKNLKNFHKNNHILVEQQKDENFNKSLVIWHVSVTKLLNPGGKDFSK